MTKHLPALLAWGLRRVPRRVAKLPTFYHLSRVDFGSRRGVDLPGTLSRIILYNLPSSTADIYFTFVLSK
jgi:hypothetical protein